MFKIGDRVKVKKEECRGSIEEYDVGEIIEKASDFPSWRIRFDTFQAEVCEKYLINVEPNNSLTNKSMNLKEKFVLALTKEPQKSFRKVEITNGDDILTEEGQKVFLSWLLHKVYADQFKKEVVDDLLKEQEEETK